MKVESYMKREPLVQKVEKVERVRNSKKGDSFEERLMDAKRKLEEKHFHTKI